MQKVCVNLGCGERPHKSDENIKWVNLDQFPNPGVDLVANLEEGIPLEDNSVDFIFASHVLEHLDNWVALLKDCHRILKPRGVLNIRVPEGSCRAAWTDPTHKRPFYAETFHHFAIGQNMGFDTLQDMRLFNLVWLEVLEHWNNHLDDGHPGAWFKEVLVDYEKPGASYLWEADLLCPKS